ncbi:hypothetical protein ACFYXM_11715 [Streptomyces sp. NPDC002476]|uniref:hypothetical protein n=1 Tax=Streptomyces sp. NPDC002476 TaxID=3364648 RepID=UPI00368E0CEA
MSTDFDFNSQPAAAASGAPGAGTATLQPPAAPAPAPAPRAGSKPAAEIDSEPISGLTTLAITAAPPVAMIAASYLAHLYGQWMMVGLAMAGVVVAAVGVRAAWRRARDRRANKGKGSGAARTTRTNPSARAGGRLLGSRGTGATGGRSGGGLFGRGGKGAAGRKTAAQAAGGLSSSAGARSAKRNERASAAAKSAMGGAGKGAAGRHITSGRSTGPSKKATSGLGAGAKSSAARTGATPRTPSPAPRSSASGGSARRNSGAHVKPGLTKRALDKFTKRGFSSKDSAAKKGAGAQKQNKKSKSRKPTVKQTGSKAAAADRAAKNNGKSSTNAPKKPTASKTDITKNNPEKKDSAKSPTKVSDKKRNAADSGKRKVGPNKKSYTKGAKKMHRRLKRAATSRKVRMMKRGGKKLWRGGRQSLRASNAIVSPILAKGAMAVGKRLGWAHRHMLRIANSSSGPNFMPRLARGMAWGLAKALRTGQWVMRRKKVSAWLLRHYAATGLASPAGVAASAARKVSLKKAVKVNPGAPVPIHVPSSPTTTGAKIVGATPIEAVSEAFDFVTGQYEPESVEGLTQHLDDFAPMFENFAESLMRMAERLQDEYGVKPGVIDMLLEFGSACAGMTDMVQSVIESWRIEQAEDIERHENPRPGEAEFWNVQG